MDEPSTAARTIAFQIARKHARLFQEDMPINDLIDDVANAIDVARSVGESAGRAGS